MRQLKPVIQDAADRINDPMIDDDAQAIKATVLIYRITKQAIQANSVEKEPIVPSQNGSNTNGSNTNGSNTNGSNTIVTGDDIRDEMNRKMRNEGYLR
jgi:hypothetical protein